MLLFMVVFSCKLILRDDTSMFLISVLNTLSFAAEGIFLYGHW